MGFYLTGFAVIISIHAPRGGSDKAHPCPLLLVSNFNPRSPWGERRLRLSPFLATQIFQSTLPVGGAT